MVPWGDAATDPNAAGPDAASETPAPAEAETSEADARESAAAEPIAANTDGTTTAGQLSDLDESITDGDTIRTLNRALYDSILSELTPPFGLTNRWNIGCGFQKTVISSVTKPSMPLGCC